MANVRRIPQKKLLLVRVDSVPLEAEVETAYVGGHANV